MPKGVGWSGKTGGRTGHAAHRPEWRALQKRWKKAQDRDKSISADDLEKWRWLMDPRQVDPQRFQELVFEIKLATPDEDADEDDGMEGLYAPFVDRVAQDDLWKEIQACWERGTWARLLNLKARQHGISYKVQSIMAERVSRHVGDGTTVCQDVDSSNEMHARLKEFLDQIPEWALPERIKDRTEVIRFKHNNGRTSSVRVLTAGRDSLGRSLTNHWLHISEFAWWPESAKKHLGGLLRTLHRGPGNFAVIECTAKGFDAFYRRWNLATAGKGGWTPKFYNWLMHPDYLIPFQSDADRAVFEASVGSSEDYGGHREIELVTVHGATLEHLNFRRETIDGDLEGHLPTWDQEFPTIPDDAFISTGRPALPREILRSWMPIAEAKEKASFKAELAPRFRDSAWEVEASKSRGGLWRIYEKPIAGEAYCYGVDVAKGYEVHADGKTESDFSTIKIGHIFSGRTVAHMHGHIFPRDLASEVMKGAYMYGMANGYIERNQDGGEVISFVEDEEIGGRSGAETLLKQRRIVLSDGKRAYAQEAGFKTTVKTKKWLIGQFRKAIQDVGFPNKEWLEEPEKYIHECPWDVLTIKEAMFYSYTPTGALAASEGHDDTVISESLKYVSRDFLWDDLELLCRVAPQQSDMLIRIKERVRAQQELEREHADEHEDILGSGY